MDDYKPVREPLLLDESLDLTIEEEKEPPTKVVPKATRADNRRLESYKSS